MMDVGEREQGVDGNERDIERPAQTLSQAAGNAQSGKGAGAGSEGNSLKSFTLPPAAVRQPRIIPRMTFVCFCPGSD